MMETAAGLTLDNNFSARSLKIGSEEHKRRFCRMLLDTFDPYKPSVIAWPKLDADALARLTSLPFWDIAVQTEGYASARVQALADTVADPLLKEAVQLNAFEEGRHKLVLEHMIRFYGIKLKPEPQYRASRDAEWAFIRTGYGECFDSFFAFGLFKLAKDSGYFPPELVEVFEPVVSEEGRHILFFVNWAAWTAANKPLLGGLWFRLRCFAALAVSAWNRLSLAGTAADGGKSGDNFVVSGGAAFTASLTPRGFLAACLAENNRRMAGYDAGLLRPKIMPVLTRMALFFIRK
ncbi:MAG: ferritin-like domain-containing protein [Alphaproteobacteria bacterium]